MKFTKQNEAYPEKGSLTVFLSLSNPQSSSKPQPELLWYLHMAVLPLLTLSRHGDIALLSKMSTTGGEQSPGSPRPRHAAQGSQSQ